eukprot:TRINITY_DN111614_c0_g1_i1.p1 TRINITY_DN111614_c0_g1~~TRINITY_DN111614_c0_g1_i1.p1  ORF type:complete len:384 (+),score=103.54 TRINITY_DN111614_c0_g1_i1:79-1230(+)
MAVPVEEPAEPQTGMRDEETAEAKAVEVLLSEAFSSADEIPSPEVIELRAQVQRLTREAVDTRLHYQAQVAALTYEVQWLRAHLGSIGQSICEELSSLSASMSQLTPPAQTPTMAATAAVWTAQQTAAGQMQAAAAAAQQRHNASIATSRNSASEAVTAALCAQIVAGGTGSTACVELSSPTTSEVQEPVSRKASPPPTPFPANTPSPPPPPPPPAQCSAGKRSGDELMSLLRAGIGKKDSSTSEHHSDPLPLSLDEFCLWQMQAREDAEGGADVRNVETFGADARSGWSFEDNLAANIRLEQGHRGSSGVNTWGVHKVRTSTESTTGSTFVEGDAMSISSSQSGGSGAGIANKHEASRSAGRRRRRAAAVAHSGATAPTVQI